MNMKQTGIIVRIYGFVNNFSKTMKCQEAFNLFLLGINLGKGFAKRYLLDPSLSS